MIIGIDGSRAFLKRRTGIEEYGYQVIKHLRDVLSNEHQVILYVRKKFEKGNGKWEIRGADIDFSIPKNWKVRALWAPRLWTQVALSWEMLRHPPDVLFVPAHTIPIIHPRNTVVAVHGLEYEFCRQAYSRWARFFLRFFTRYSCRAAKKIISVSQNTKHDIMRLYKISESKIEVIYEGLNDQSSPPVISHRLPVTKPYLLFIGRLEERKNIVRIVEAFEILKKEERIPHTLVLAGKSGYGYKKIQFKIQNSKFKKEIRELGYVTEDEKWELLKKADVFVFPTLYEGFGLPVLEAQAAGVPVVTSLVSSLPEVGGEGAVYVDPSRSENIARGIQKLLARSDIRDDIIRKGQVNVGKFGWPDTARAIGALLLNQET